jgi:hypothetical protein
MTANNGDNANNAKIKDAGVAVEPARQSPRFLGSLRDALRAASVSDEASKQPASPIHTPAKIDRHESLAKVAAGLPPLAPTPIKAARPEGRPEARADPLIAKAPILSTPDQAGPRAAELPRPAEFPSALQTPEPIAKRPQAPDATTNLARSTMEQQRPKPSQDRTHLVRGRLAVPKTDFHQDPVVGWLVVVGGQGLGAFRPIFEGNNTVGRARTQRIAIDFGDEAISNEEQAYIRYDSADRSFLFVPNLSKTNVVSINNKKPTAAVPLEPMDVITMGRTQLAFVPFCGNDFDWSELADRKT